MRYTDPDGSETKYPTNGSSALKCIEENAPEKTVPKTAIGATKKAGIIGIIVLFCLSLQGSSVAPALPPNYDRDNYGNIHAPNGAVIATVEQAWKHADGDPDWADVEGWGKGTFPTANASLLDHFDRHGAEVGATTPEQYLNKAKGFAQNLKGCHKRPSYNKKTGKLTGTRYTKNGKYVILDINTKEILSFGAENHNGDL